MYLVKTTNGDKILNSADYGVPQNRNRVFFVGIKNKKFKFPEEKSKKVFVQRAYSCSIKREQSFVADTESSLLRTISKN